MTARLFHISGIALIIGSATASTGLADVVKIDFGPLGRSVYELGPDINDAARHGPAPDLPMKLAEKRREAIEYTRRNMSHVLCEVQWAIPLRSLYGWSVTYGFETYQDTENAVRQLFDTLQTVTPVNRNVAAKTMGRICGIFANTWIRTMYAPECLRLLDEMEAWILAEPAYPEHWYIPTSTIQAHAILYRELFPPDQRDWVVQSRRERLERWLLEPHLPFHLRTRTVTQWANAHYLTGDGEMAQTVLRSWWRRHKDRIDDELFYAVWMKVLIYGIMDWKQAGGLLEYINTLADGCTT